MSGSTKKEAEILAEDWSNPDLGKIPFAKYCSDWIDERPGLRPKTVRWRPSAVCGGVSWWLSSVRTLIWKPGRFGSRWLQPN